MNCGDINELSPLWHSGELDAESRKSFSAHIAACSDCASDLLIQASCDARLREAIAAEPADTQAIEAGVMRRIARERIRRWLWPGVAAAAAILATVLVLNRPRPLPVNPAIFADAARDHTAEVIKQTPRRWRTDPVEIASLETAQGIPDSDVKALLATGYLLERAKPCRLAGTPYLHLVYVKDGREFSVFLKARGNQAAFDDASSTTGNLQLASFTGANVQAVIVTDAPRGECAKFTHDAKAAL